MVHFPAAPARWPEIAPPLTALIWITCHLGTSVSGVHP